MSPVIRVYCNAMRVYAHFQGARTASELVLVVCTSPSYSGRVKHEIADEQCRKPWVPNACAEQLGGPI